MPSGWGRLLPAAAGAVCLAIAIAACSNESSVTPTAKAGVCDYRVAPTSVKVGTISEAISLYAIGDSTCQWMASTTDAWIHIVTANTGQGSGGIRLTADTQSPEPRHGTVTVVWTAGGASIDVEQRCWSNMVTGTVNVTAASQVYVTAVLGGGCTFLTGNPVRFDVPWMYFASQRGGGSWLEIAIDRNTGPERTGHVITDLGIITVVQGTGN